MSRFTCAALLAVLGLCAPAPGQDRTFLDRPAERWGEDLYNNDPAVRRGAVFAIGQMGRAVAGATPQLLSILKTDSDPGVRETTAVALGHLAAPKFDGTSDIQELQVLGNWAYMWTKLRVIATPPDGSAPTVRSGHTLTLLRKERGRWRLARDANLLAPE